ncbi:MAG: FGGY-family carbohydrate kinase [Eubacteriales bacterium]
MVVLERPLSQVYPEIDMVTTPDGKPVAMVHCNNCTSEINAWAGMLQEFAHCIGKSDLSDDRLYSLLYSKAAEGEDGGGLLCCNYLSGEPVVDMEEGRPLWYAVRKAAGRSETLCAHSCILLWQPLK